MKVKNLCFQHKKQAPYFFKNLFLELETDCIHALHGKNGIGKSVLLRILSGHVDKECVMTGEIISGTVECMNQQFDQGLASQFTFLENLRFGSFNRFPNPFSWFNTAMSSIKEEVLSLFKRFHIDITVPVHKLSGGQRQILALLMKVQRNSTVLLLDEPTAALDEENACMVFEFLQGLKAVTTLVVCHDLALTSRYVTGRSIYMEKDAQGLRILK